MTEPVWRALPARVPFTQFPSASVAVCVEFGGEE